MKMTIAFKKMKHSQEVDQRIQDKSQKLSKFIDGNIKLDWTCFKSEGKHCADLKLTGPTFEYSAGAKSDNLYKAIDQVINKVEKQIQRKKDKWKNHINRNNKSVSDMVILEPEVAWSDYDEDKFDDVA